jgi:wyosine [tRNA(Phe)-imidazoG37] synthetase (radical SAM superfamily)
MRITIKALLRRKFNDRAKKQAEAAKAVKAEPEKQEVEPPVHMPESNKQLALHEQIKDSETGSSSAQLAEKVEIAMNLKESNEQVCRNYNTMEQLLTIFSHVTKPTKSFKQILRLILTKRNRRVQQALMVKRSIHQSRMVNGWAMM